MPAVAGDRDPHGLPTLAIVHKDICNAIGVNAGDVMNQVEKQEKLIRDNAKFERRAEVAEKELEKLKFQFNTLETEYKRLYDEMESEGGEEAAEQPDFPG